MTTLADKLVEAGARAARNSKAWPEVFSPGSAELLTRAALLAVLPMVAEDLQRIADSEAKFLAAATTAVGLPDDSVRGHRAATEGAQAALATLLSDLKSERGEG